jgi:hypothetical protein
MGETNITTLIPFSVHRHTFSVAKAEVPLVPIRPICEALGIDSKVQRRKLHSHPTFGSVGVMVTSTASDGKLYDMFAMPADMVMGWLLTIHPDRVAPRVRGALVEFQRHLFRAAYEAWTSARNGLPVHGGGRPRQGMLFEPQNPMDWLRHPTVLHALSLWDAASDVEAQAREQANSIRVAAREAVRRIGLSGKAFAALRDWAEQAPLSPVPALPTETEEG